MTAIPNKLPEWATAVGADIVEPLQTQKEDGWDADDRPPSGWENWKAKLAYQWLQWISAIQVKNWTVYDTAHDTDRMHAVCWGLGWWVAVGTQAGNTINRSRGGGDWSSDNPGSDDFTGVFSSDTHVVAVGENGMLYWATDPDGGWTDNTSGISGSNDFRDVHYGNGDWAVVDEVGDLWTATNPTGSWVKNTSPSWPGMYKLLYVEELSIWVCVGNESSPFPGIAYASDPAGTWTNISSTPISGASYRDVCWNGRIVCAVGDNGTPAAIVKSANGVDFTDESTSLINGVPFSCVGDPFGHILIANEGRLWLTSDDCDNFEQVECFNKTWRRMAYHSGQGGGIVGAYNQYMGRTISL